MCGHRLLCLFIIHTPPPQTRRRLIDLARFSSARLCVAAARCSSCGSAALHSTISCLVSCCLTQFCGNRIRRFARSRSNRPNSSEILILDSNKRRPQVRSSELRNFEIFSFCQPVGRTLLLPHRVSPHASLQRVDSRYHGCSNVFTCPHAAFYFPSLCGQHKSLYGYYYIQQSIGTKKKLCTATLTFFLVGATDYFLLFNVMRK